MHSILVERALQFICPYAPLEISRRMYYRSKWTPERFQPDAVRPNEPWWHLGRIEFFVREIREGRPLDPISIDMRWNHMSPTGLVLIDGHHRLCAADIMGVTRIPCEYGGLVDTLTWLEGQSDRAPCF